MVLTQFSHAVHKEQVALLALNGALAFALNVVSFGANKRVGAVGMTVAGTSYSLLITISLFFFCFQESATVRDVHRSGERTYVFHLVV